MSILDILSENLVVRLRLIIYGVLVFFSFFIFVGVAVMKDKVNGFCPLFSKPYNPGPVSNCNYPMAIAIIYQLIYALIRIVILVLLVLCKFTTDMFLFSNILEFVYVVIDAVAFILTFIGAIILSAGHNASSLDYSMSAIKTSSNVAQAGSWISTFLWLFLAGVGILYILRAGKVPWRSTSSSAATGTTGAATTNTPPVDTPQNYDPSKY